MKKALCIFLIFLIFFIIYFLQSNICSLIKLNNIKPNLFLVYAVFLGVAFNKYIAYSLAIVMGLFLDLTIGQNLGIFAIGLGITALISNILKNRINYINRITVSTIMAILTIVYNIIIYLLNIIIIDINVELIEFIKVAFIEMLYNSLIIILIYPILKKKTEIIQEIFEFKNILI